MTRLLLVLVTAAAVTAGATGATNAAFPSRIDLPDGFQPEGIATAGQQFYVGSIPTGAVYRGSLRTGAGAILVPGQAGRAATGLEANRGRLWVSGAGTGSAFVYNARTGANITSYTLSTGGSFVNDVAVTRNTAWFTDSFKPVLYRVPVGPNGEPGPAAGVTTVPLSGDYVHQSGFNLNGIDATPNGNTLVVVQSGTGKLFTVTTAGVTDEIVLRNGESVPNGDGILLAGRTLYVVQNQLNVIAKIKLAANLRTGRVVTRTGNPGFDVPTTIADHGRRLYAVNARFGTAPTPTTEYWITQVRK
jgi:outer membrane protein assembly factor BamB